MKVELSLQVVEFVRRQPPEPRGRLRRALKGLRNERGDIKRLEGPLSEYCRLRVGGYRVILSYGRTGVIQCVYAEQRGIVYEVFAEALHEALLAGPQRKA